MALALKLQEKVRGGVHQIGMLTIKTDVLPDRFVLAHCEDAERMSAPDYGGLEVHHGPADAREISTFAPDGTYRFTKVQNNLKRGWVMLLKSAEDLRLALDHFYPACVGLHFANEEGTLEIEMLRDKLRRQTGMYRFTKSISDAGAQRVVRDVCGPANRCARKILWQIDPETPLEDSDASRYNGIFGDVPETKAIPLLCREACNHFVAECRKVAQAEAKRKTETG